MHETDFFFLLLLVNIIIVKILVDWGGGGEMHDVIQCTQPASPTFRSLQAQMTSGKEQVRYTESAGRPRFWRS